jgi:hypothetical protein
VNALERQPEEADARMNVVGRHVPLDPAGLAADRELLHRHDAGEPASRRGPRDLHLLGLLVDQAGEGVAFEHEVRGDEVDQLEDDARNGDTDQPTSQPRVA